MLYAVFLSGILRGEFFPDFACSADPFTSYSDFGDCNPTTHADIALAVLWGFIAGFAEHFVPNILDNLVSETADADGATSAGEDV